MSYANQTDIENRISVKTLAQLTNDTANATTANATIVAAILTNVDATIDAQVGGQYVTPFSPIPALIKRIEVDIACYEFLQRRPTGMEMPKHWQVAYDNAKKQLNDIAIGLLELPASATIETTQSSINTSNAVDAIFFTTTDVNNTMQDF